MEVETTRGREYLGVSGSVLALDISSKSHHFMLGLPPAQSDLNGANFGFFEYSDGFRVSQSSN